MKQTVKRNRSSVLNLFIAIFFRSVYVPNKRYGGKCRKQDSEAVTELKATNTARFSDGRHQNYNPREEMAESVEGR
jgi:hypothetical protein